MPHKYTAIYSVFHFFFLSLSYIIVSTAAHTVHCTYARQDKRALKTGSVSTLH